LQIWKIPLVGQLVVKEINMKIGASFSSCCKYRYKLWRIWDESKPLIMFIGLNPSKADETHDDPTVSKCQRYARQWGYGGIIMANIFAYCTSVPAEMKKALEPIGCDNDDALMEMAPKADIVVAAWGNHGTHMGRSLNVKRLFHNLHYLKLNKTGEPAHPLYLKSNVSPIPWIFDLGS
jgi:hypothetical protein